MREIFVDTSAWAAITDSTDANHAAAVAFRPFQTNNYPRRHTKTHEARLFLRENLCVFVDNLNFEVALGNKLRVKATW